MTIRSGSPPLLCCRIERCRLLGLDLPVSFCDECLPCVPLLDSGVLSYLPFRFTIQPLLLRPRASPSSLAHCTCRRALRVHECLHATTHNDASCHSCAMDLQPLSPTSTSLCIARCPRLIDPKCALYSSKLSGHVLCCANHCWVARYAPSVAPFCTTSPPSNLRPHACETMLCASLALSLSLSFILQYLVNNGNISA